MFLAGHRDYNVLFLGGFMKAFHLLVAISIILYAQQVFSAEKKLPLDFLNGPVILNDKEKAALQLSNEWKNKRDIPRRGPDGSIRYLFGATLPTIVCSPLQVCNVHLQNGENLTGPPHAGDTVNWNITPAVQGSGSYKHWIAVIKPTDANLTTSLTIMTDRRTYSMKLISHQSQWMPNVSFDYPDDLREAWSTVVDANNREAEARIMPEGIDVARLDFCFMMKGDQPSWRPIRIYTDNIKTYIQFPKILQEMPALVSLDTRKNAQLVNYRIVGDRFVVDKVLEHAALILGVGRDQQKVEISRIAGR